MPDNTLYTTFVTDGGTPVRIANQTGAPYPTTGTGALVFGTYPTMSIHSSEVLSWLAEGTGANGTVLTSVGPGSPPQWLPGSGGGGGGITGANFAYAVSNTGAFSVTDPIVSTQCYSIRDLKESGGAYQVWLATIPVITPTTLTVRVDGGMNWQTKGVHPAEGTWTVTTTSNPYLFTLVGSVVVANSVFDSGHCYVPGTLIEASLKLNVLSAWAQANSPATLYLPLGGMYVKDRVVGFPQGFNVVGHGGFTTFFFLADRVDMPTLKLNHVVTNTLGSPFIYGNIDNEWNGFAIYGNRANQLYLAGQHALDLGSGINTDIPLTIKLTDIHVRGSAGYSMSFGNKHAVIGCRINRCSFKFSDSDNIDMKDSLSRNFNNQITNCDFGWHAMQDQGTSLKPLIALSEDVIHTTNGSSSITIPHGFDSNMFEGTTVTFAGVVDFAGLSLNGSFGVIVKAPLQSSLAANPFHTTSTGINIVTVHQVAHGKSTNDLVGFQGGTLSANGITILPKTQKAYSLTVVDADNYTITATGSSTTTAAWGATGVIAQFGTYTLDVSPQVANTTMYGGGASMTMFNPTISIGDVAFDMRGLGWLVNNVTWEGECWLRNVFRQRGGEAGGPNGQGAHNCVMSNLIAKDLTPAWIGFTDSFGRGGLALGGDGALVTNFTFTTTGHSIGISTDATANNAFVSNFNLEGCLHGIRSRGDRCTFTNGRMTDSVYTDITNYGEALISTQQLPEDPFHTATTGTAVVIVNAPNHQRTTGDIVNFAGLFLSANGVTIIRSNLTPNYVLTVINANSYQFTASGSSTTTDPWGGLNTLALYGTDPHTATRNCFSNLTLLHTGANDCIAINNGFVIAGTSGSPQGRARSTQYYFIENVGAGATPPFRDAGGNTFWGPGNINLPNQAEFDTMNMPALDEPGWGDPVQTWMFNGTTSPTAQFGNLNVYSQVRMEILSIACNATSNFVVEVSSDGGATYYTTNGDYGRIGVGSGTSSLVFCGSVVSGTGVSAFLEFSSFNQTTPSLVNMQGGANNAASGVSTGAGVVTAAIPLTNVRVRALSGQISAGVIRIYGKQ